MIVLDPKFLTASFIKFGFSVRLMKSLRKIHDYHAAVCSLIPQKIKSIIYIRGTVVRGSTKRGVGPQKHETTV